MESGDFLGTEDAMEAMEAGDPGDARGLESDMAVLPGDTLGKQLGAHNGTGPHLNYDCPPAQVGTHSSRGAHGTH